jgi:hypothetical protein
MLIAWPYDHPLHPTLIETQLERPRGGPLNHVSLRLATVAPSTRALTSSTLACLPLAAIHAGDG